MTKHVTNSESNSSIKPVLSESFVGTIDQIREYFSRKWCRIYQIDEEKWRYIAPSSIDGIKIKNKETGFEMSFWAGGSGTNNMAIDGTGGCCDLSFYREDIFEVIV